MVEVDLKRQGRLDVHIPLFPPADAQGIKELFLSMAKKLKLDLVEEDLPTLLNCGPISGNELEGLLVRAIRQYELQPAEGRRPLKEILAQVSAGFTPSRHTTQLEIMDLLAVKECTDVCFLPERFASLSGAQIERRLSELGS
jgi:hypothetical protein